MSGICGWSSNTQNTPIAAATLEKMSSRLSHGKTETATDILGPNFALSASSRFGDESGVYTLTDYHVAFTGRIRWRDTELQQIANDHGVGRALLEGYLRAGFRFLERFYGPFALALIDASHQCTLLAIDRLGIYPLNYAIKDGRLLFGSDARAIAAHPDASTALSQQALFDYLYFHMVPAPRCIFAEQRKLLPGEYGVFKNGGFSTAFYWQPTYHETTELSARQLEQNFREKLEHAVADAANTEKIGAFLSGGTDSSTVAGLLQKIKGTPVDTYSIGFNAPGFDEIEYARIAARHFGTRAHEYYVTPQDVLDAIPSISAAYDEPFGNASAVPSFFCAKLAKKDGIDVLLAGDGGDELFGGNARYAKQRVFEYYRTIPEPLRRFLLEPIAFNDSLAALPLLSKARSYIQQANTPLPDRLESYNLLNRIPLTEIFTPDFLSGIDTHEPIANLRATYQRAQAETHLNRMLYLDLKFTLADNDLRKINRMCELAGIAVRYPLLDENVLDFSIHLPSSLKLKGSKLRYFFKQALKDFLPREILTKPKHGFGLPFGLWMTTYPALESMARESLACLAQRGYILTEFTSRLLDLHQQHANYYGVMVWVLMMLEQWLQQNDRLTPHAS